MSNPAPATKKETADDTKRCCGFAIFVLKSSFSMILRAFFIFMPFPRIASATTAGAGIASATHTIVQVLNRSGIDIENKNALWYN
ncbi:MAG: hypothetical protein E7598_00860 [Ruminococcaceae bacterium]|nr:hypothetical protein [Oscillospiraceae bacterium]